jgi:hypothetical protein
LSAVSAERLSGLSECFSNCYSARSFGYHFLISPLKILFFPQIGSMFFPLLILDLAGGFQT